MVAGDARHHALTQRFETSALSHSVSFDQRRRPETLRTAMAMAFFCPTRTTSRLPRVTPVVEQITLQHGVVLSVMTGITTAGYSGSTGSRAAKFGHG
jgi:hypothetical protein